MKAKKKPAKKRKAPAKPHANEALALRRAEDLVRIRLDGAEFIDVREYVREKEQEEGSAWHLKPRATPMSDQQLYRYVARADELIASSLSHSRRGLIREHRARRRNLYARAVLTADYRTALACLRDEAELLGLYAPRKVAPTTPDGKRPFPMTEFIEVAAPATPAPEAPADAAG